MNPKILLVDDDQNLLSGLRRGLRQQFSLETAAGAEEGLAKLNNGGPFAVVVSDRQMPGMDGAEFLSLCRRQAPDTVRIMLTGNVDLEQAVHVVNAGNIFRFLIKPCPFEVLSAVLEDAVAQHRLVVAEKELLNKTLQGTIKLLTDILSIVDSKSFGRGEKLRALLTEVATKMGLKDAWEIQVAAMLGPIGYVTLPPEILVKARANKPLLRDEQQLFDSVPEIGARLLSNIPRLEGAANIALHLHKHFDGKGLPPGPIAGQKIPYGSRLLKILNDLLDLQAKGLHRSQALDEMSLRGGIYDPEILSSVKASLGVIGGNPDGEWDCISIGVNDLAPGMVLNSDVLTKDDTLILSAGNHLNAMILEKIQNFKAIYGIKEPIYVRTPHRAPIMAPIDQLQNS